MRDDDRRQIKLLVAASLTSLALGLAALAFVLAFYFTEPGREQTARTATCHLLRELVFHATPPAKLKEAEAYIATTPLRNCQAYGLHP